MADGKRRQTKTRTRPLTDPSLSTRSLNFLSNSSWWRLPRAAAALARRWSNDHAMLSDAV